MATDNTSGLIAIGIALVAGAAALAGVLGREETTSGPSPALEELRNQLEALRGDLPLGMTQESSGVETVDVNSDADAEAVAEDPNAVGEDALENSSAPGVLPGGSETSYSSDSDDGGSTGDSFGTGGSNDNPYSSAAGTVEESDENTSYDETDGTDFDVDVSGPDVDFETSGGDEINEFGGISVL